MFVLQFTISIENNFIFSTFNLLYIQIYSSFKFFVKLKKKLCSYLLWISLVYLFHSSQLKQ